MGVLEKLITTGPVLLSMATVSKSETPLENMDDPSLVSQLKYPGEWWNTPVGEEIRETEEKMREELDGADIISISDTDTDGLACFSILMNAFPDKKVARLPTVASADAMINPVDVMDIVLSSGPSGAPIYMSDLRPDEEYADKLLNRLEQHMGPVMIFDHHEWDEDIREKFEDVSSLFIESGESEDGEGVCAANILFDHVEDKIKESEEADFDQIKELVEITRDHDVWIKEDERSDDLSTLQAELDEYEYTNRISEMGAGVLEDDKTRRDIAQARYETNLMIEVAAKRAEWVRVIKTEGGDIRILENGDTLKPFERAEEEIVVALAYGDVYQSGLGNVLIDGWHDWFGEDKEEYEHKEHAPEVDYRQNNFRPGDADIMALVKPWGTVSLRSSDDYPVCHNIAEDIGGGGHKRAAGCNPGLVGKNSQITNGMNWETEGKLVKAENVDSIRGLFENGELFDEEE